MSVVAPRRTALGPDAGFAAVERAFKADPFRAARLVEHIRAEVRRAMVEAEAFSPGDTQILERAMAEAERRVERARIDPEFAVAWAQRIEREVPKLQIGEVATVPEVRKAREDTDAEQLLIHWRGVLRRTGSLDHVQLHNRTGPLWVREERRKWIRRALIRERDGQGLATTEPPPKAAWEGAVSG